MKTADQRLRWVSAESEVGGVYVSERVCVCAVLSSTHLLCYHLRAAALADLCRPFAVLYPFRQSSWTKMEDDNKEPTHKGGLCDMLDNGGTAKRKKRAGKRRVATIRDANDSTTTRPSHIGGQSARPRSHNRSHRTHSTAHAPSRSCAARPTADAWRVRRACGCM